nr:putative ribonuclease H-like domain-containing protein [Tanacetum cinerariifolium]
MHNNIMAAGSRDRPLMLAPGRYPQWRSRFLRYVDTRPNGEALRKYILSGPYKPTTVLVQAVDATDDSPVVSEHMTVETPMNMFPENKAHFLREKEAIHLILNGIGDNIYSIVDACQRAQEAIERLQQDACQRAQEAIERLQQSESLNIQDVKTNLFWEFRKFTLYDGESMESYYTKFYKLMNEMIRNNLTVTMMQKNLALITKYFKKIYKPTNNNLITSSNYKNKNVDTTPRFKNDNQSGQFGNQRREFGHFAKECKNPKRVKDSAYHKEKMLLCKKAEQVELNDSNVIPDSPDMCEDDIQNDQNDVESDDEQMHADLKYVESLEKEIDKLESDKAEFSDMYVEILQECVSKDVMCSYLMSLSDLDALAELQCMFLHKVKECDCLVQKLSKQTESVSKKVHTKLLQCFSKVEKHSISLEIALQKCKNSELKKLIGKGKGKSVDTKFDKPSVVRQLNAQQIPKPSVLGKPTPFSNSLDKIYFPKTMSVSKANVSEGLSKPVTAQTFPQAAKKVVCNTNVLKPGMYRIDNRTVHTRAPQLPQTVRNTNPRMSTSTKHMTGNLKLLCNFVEKFLGTVRFGNDQFAHILGYGDLVQGNVTINRVYYVEGLNHNLFLVGQFCDADLEVAFKKSTCFVGNDQFAHILGYGDLVQGNVTINRVYYVEGLNHNLFLVGQFCDADLEVAFKKSTCFVRYLQGNDLLTGNYGSDLYTISLQESTSSTLLYLMAKATPTQAWLWHRRLSHLNFDYIKLLSKKDIVIGLPKLKYDKDQLYLCGPMRVASINGKKYILVIVDDYSRYMWTMFLHSKDETPEVLRDFLMMIQRNLQALVIIVRTDRGTKFLNKTLNAFFKEEGIEHQTSTARTPKQNGVVERQNRTLVEAARTMLSDSQLP